MAIPESNTPDGSVTAAAPLPIVARLFALLNSPPAPKAVAIPPDPPVESASSESLEENVSALEPEYRRHGLGSRMVGICLASLRKLGILKCNIFRYSGNELGEQFWRRHGWSQRDDLQVFQIQCSEAFVTVPEGGPRTRIVERD